MKTGFIRKYWVEIGIGGGLVIAATGMAVPGYLRGRSADRMRTCQENLTKIDGSKEQWALENCQIPGALPGAADIATGKSGYLKEFPACPSGASYLINPVGEDPICPSSLPGHALSEVAGPGWASCHD